MTVTGRPGVSPPEPPTRNSPAQRPLTTHLSVPGIAAELFLSPHTIRSQMKSIYRKLGVNSRNQAVTRAREAGLLEG